LREFDPEAGGSRLKAGCAMNSCRTKARRRVWNNPGNLVAEPVGAGLESIAMTKNGVFTAVLTFLLILGGIALAQRPKENIDPARHPNLAAAQRFTQQAWDKMVAAQTANEWDLGGHAQKAKESLDVADREMRLAATAANRR
jgi:hypothetical protein